MLLFNKCFVDNVLLWFDDDDVISGDGLDEWLYVEESDGKGFFNDDVVKCLYIDDGDE